jgi:hypothetical protein
MRDGLMYNDQSAPPGTARGVARVDRNVSDFLET